MRAGENLAGKGGKIRRDRRTGWSHPESGRRSRPRLGGCALRSFPAGYSATARRFCSSRPAIVDKSLLAIAQPLSLQGGVDARAQQHRIERFRKVVFGPRLDATHDAVDLVERRDHDDRNMPDDRIGLEPAQDLESVHIRHHQIEQDKIELGFGHRLERRSSAVRRRDGWPSRRSLRESSSRLAAVSSTTRMRPDQPSSRLCSARSAESTA